MSNPFLSNEREFIIECRVFSNIAAAMEYRSTDIGNIPSGYAYIGSIQSNEIVSYNTNNALSGQGICLGDIVTGSYDLTIMKSAFDRLLKGHERDMDTLSVHVRLGIANPDSSTRAVIWKNFGVWYIDSVDIDYYDSIVNVHGSDFLSRVVDYEFEDQSTYTSSTTWGDVLTRVLDASDRLLSEYFSYDFASKNYTVFNGVSVTSGRRRPWWTPISDGMTETDAYTSSSFRDVLSTIACYAGGYGFVDLDGCFQIKTYRYENRYPITITKDYYSKFTTNLLVSTPIAVDYEYVGSYTYSKDSSGVYKYSSVDVYSDYQTSRDTNAIMRIDKVHPIKGVYSHVNDINSVLKTVGTIYSGSIDFIGDVALQIGQIVEVRYTDTNGSDHTCRLLASSVSFTFNGGLSCSITSSIPTNQEYYSGNRYRDSILVED